MTRVLLIAGARSLAKRPGAEAWARAKIAEALAGCDLLIVGDAPGPDAWALAIAQSHRINGNKYVTRGKHAGMILQHCENSTPYAEFQWAYSGAPDPRHPLHRNRAMAEDAASLRADGHTVSVLALLDGLKVDVPPRNGKPGERATRGTEHTVGLARAAGLTVREEVWRG